MNTVVLKLDLLDDRIKQKAMQNVSSLVGVDSISVDMKDKKLTVTGDVDPVIIVSRLRKICHTEVIFVGPEKELEKKEGDKKKEAKKKKKEKKKDAKKRKQAKKNAAAEAATQHHQPYPYYNYQQQQPQPYNYFYSYQQQQPQPYSYYHNYQQQQPQPYSYSQYYYPPTPYYTRVVHDDTPSCVIS